nr:hypothetical protein [Streptomyces caelestis]
MSLGLPYDFSPMTISFRKPAVATTWLCQVVYGPEPLDTVSMSVLSNWVSKSFSRASCSMS